MLSSTTRRPFEFVANHIVLDFINTVNARPVFTRDDLRVAGDVADWARAAGVISADQAMRRHPDVVAQFEAAVTLREQLYGVFGPIAAGRDPTDAPLVSVVRRAAAAVPIADWSRAGNGYEPTWLAGSI